MEQRCYIHVEHFLKDTILWLSYHAINCFDSFYFENDSVCVGFAQCFRYLHVIFFLQNFTQSQTSHSQNLLQRYKIKSNIPSQTSSLDPRILRSLQHH